MGASATKKTISIEKGQGRKAPEMHVKPGRKRQADVDLADDKKKETRTFRPTRSIAAARVSKNVEDDPKVADETLRLMW